MYTFEVQTINAIPTVDANRMMSAGVFEKHAGIKCTQKVARSMIHPDYANRFIREYILEQ